MLTLTRLAAAPEVSIKRHGYQDVTNACWRNKMYRVILQEINGEKRPEKTKDYFIESNSTLFEINTVFIQSKPMFPIAHGTTKNNVKTKTDNR